jgi:hypothetical protein
MCELTRSRAIAKSCQLSSLLLVISRAADEVPNAERENLIDLAGEIAGDIAVLLLEQEQAQGANHA